MNNIIQLLNTFFIVCIILAGIFLALSVILFFVFDIRSIFNIRTGRAKKKTVQEMQDANSRTDVLKASKTGQRTRRGSLTGPLGTAPTSKRLRHSAEITPPPTPPVTQEPVTMIQVESPTPETELLAPETSVLKSQQSDAPETSAFRRQEAENRNHTNLTVTKRIIRINTEEVIP